MLRRRWLVASLVALALVVVGLVAAPLIVRQRVAKTAAARGFDVEVGSVKLRPTRVWLEDVRLVHRRLAGFEVELPWVEVRFGFFGPSEVIVHGGEVHVASDLEALRAEFAQGENKPESAPSSAAEGTRLRVRGLFVEARLGREQRVFAWGVQLDRQPSQVKVSADLVRALHPRVELELAGPHADIATPGLVLDPLGATSAHIRLLVGAEEEAKPAAAVAPSAPVTPPPKQPKSRPKKAPKAKAKADPLPPVPQAPAPSIIPLDPTRGARWLAQLGRAAGFVARRLPENGSIDLGGVFVEVVYGNASLNLGPALVKGARTARALTLSATLAASPASGSLPFELGLTLPLTAGDVELHANGGPLSFSQLGVREGDFGLSAVQSARLSAETQVKILADGTRASLTSRGEVSAVTWSQRRVAREPLLDLGFSWAVGGNVMLDGSSVELETAEFGLGAVRVSGRGRFEQGAGRLGVDAQLSVSKASCQSMFDSLPVALVPLLQGMHFRGNFSWQAGLKLDTDHLGDSKVSWRMQNGCTIDRIAPAVDPEQFKQPFVHTVLDADGEPLQVHSGPGTPDWVPFDQISRFLEAAVLTTEDGGFWNHKGFDHGAIEGSIKSNLEAGKFVRGASTISMQLAKNLYLSRDKLLSRKIQEALLTMLLEQELRKDEILELYFNVIELGPNVYGIGPAARYYFNSTAAELSASQAFYLASILPSPRAQHFEPDGTLTPVWRDTVQRLLTIAEQRHRITHAELEEALAQEVQFGVPNLLEDPTDDAWTNTVEDPWAQ